MTPPRAAAIVDSASRCDVLIFIVVGFSGALPGVITELLILEIYDWYTRDPMEKPGGIFWPVCVNVTGHS
ncbi:hypothetical protein GCM10010123_45940 [Pilimelia anulata]|uniref:Uncharacterized protein n=1 Tax=Pilimelia anulata TaxID=53371 RepID=A0A8J3FEZ7_9ACTN|nr:hypothetical protein GCM10010123_45940 [Pilimelia anulata]